MAYAKENEVVVGTKLIADGGFTCLRAGDVLTVDIDDHGGLFVPCDAGQHRLDGQLDDGDEYIGFQLAKVE